MEWNSCSIAFNSSFWDLIHHFWTFAFNIDYKLSIILASGDCGGQSANRHTFYYPKSTLTLIYDPDSNASWYPMEFSLFWHLAMTLEQWLFIIEDFPYLMVCTTYFREYCLLRGRLSNLIMLAYVWNLLLSKENKRFPLFRVDFQVRWESLFPVSNMLHR